MDRGAWQATVHGVTRVGHDLATKPPPIYYSCFLPSHLHSSNKLVEHLLCTSLWIKPWGCQGDRDSALVLRLLTVESPASPHSALLYPYSIYSSQ